MPKLILTLETSEEVEVTPDFCFQKAATALSLHHRLAGKAPEIAREWRLLGETLAAQESIAR